MTTIDTTQLEEDIVAYFLGGNDELRLNPYPFFDRMRAHDPMYASGLGPWFATGLDESLAVMRDQRYSTDPRNAIGGLLGWSEDAQQAEDQTRPFYKLAEPTILFNDAPRHTRLRRLVSRAFTPKAIANRAPRLEEMTRQLLDDLRHQEKFDFFKDFAFLLPLRAISEMLDVPIDRLDDFMRWGDTIVSQAEPGNRQNPEFLDRADREAVEAVEFFSDLIADRRRNPGEDVLSAVLEASDDEDSPVTPEEVVSLCVTLHVAGHGLTAGVLASGLLLLDRYQDQRRLLVEQPDLMSRAVEEIVRFEPPPRASVPRFALEDIELPDGRIVERGATVFALIGAANRDPLKFKDPHTFDVTRSDNPHIGFGNGAHFCLGAGLARLEAATAFNVLLREYPPIAVDPGDAQWRDSVVVRSLDALPVSWAA